MDTPEYLCPPEANTYNIDFTRFKIRDMDSGMTLFDVVKDDGDDGSPPARFVRYQFSPQFLDLAAIGAT